MCLNIQKEKPFFAKEGLYVPIDLDFSPLKLVEEEKQIPSFLDVSFNPLPVSSLLVIGPPENTSPLFFQDAPRISLLQPITQETDLQRVKLIAGNTSFDRNSSKDVITRSQTLSETYKGSAAPIDEIEELRKIQANIADLLLLVRVKPGQN